MIGHVTDRVALDLVRQTHRSICDWCDNLTDGYSPQLDKHFCDEACFSEFVRVRSIRQVQDGDEWIAPSTYLAVQRIRRAAGIAQGRDGRWKRFITWLRWKSDERRGRRIARQLRRDVRR